MRAILLIFSIIMISFPVYAQKEVRDNRRPAIASGAERSWNEAGKAYPSQEEFLKAEQKAIVDAGWEEAVKSYPSKEEFLKAEQKAQADAGWEEAVKAFPSKEQFLKAQQKAKD